MSGKMREHEFDQDDVFGVCKNCGKYVEQLMEERYCTVTNKYPNADTSPERLAEIIQDHFYESGEHLEPLGCLATWKDVRDLLAMLQERETYRQQYTKCVEACAVFQSGGELSYLMQFIGQSTTLDGPKLAAAEIKQLRQQLHDQRWRSVDKEIPPSNEAGKAADPTTQVHVRFKDGNSAIAYFWNDENNEEQGAYCFDANTDEELDLPEWWRPIPPLPTEK